MNWPGGQRDATVDNRPSWMKTLPPAPVSPAKTIKRPNPSRFQAPAPAPVVAPPVPVAAPVAAPSVPLAARAPPANHYGPAPLQPPPAAIGYRTLELGLTPNRHAVLGWNVVTLLMLAGICHALWTGRDDWVNRFAQGVGALVPAPVEWSLWLLVSLPILE
mgnify:CR=1 FL=1